MNVTTSSTDPLLRRLTQDNRRYSRICKKKSRFFENPKLQITNFLNILVSKKRVVGSLACVQALRNLSLPSPQALATRRLNTNVATLQVHSRMSETENLMVKFVNSTFLDLLGTERTVVRSQRGV